MVISKKKYLEMIRGMAMELLCGSHVGNMFAIRLRTRWMVRGPIRIEMGGNMWKILRKERNATWCRVFSDKRKQGENFVSNK